jgi:hypothetical protein
VQLLLLLLLEVKEVRHQQGGMRNCFYKDGEETFIQELIGKKIYI